MRATGEAFREPLVVGRQRVDEQLRRRAAFEIVLAHERGGEIAHIGSRRRMRKEAPVSEIDAAAHRDHHHGTDPAIDRGTDDVEIALPADLLTLGLQPTQRRDLLAQPRRGLEIQRLGRRLHLADQPVDELLVAAFEQFHRILHVARIVRLADEADTGRRASLDLVLQAGPRAVLEEAVATVAQLEQTHERVLCLLDCTGTGERAEIMPFPLLSAAVIYHPRVVVIAGDHEVGITLVIPQVDVVTRPVALDQRGFKQQRLVFRMRDRDLDIRHLVEHGLGLGVARRAQEIAGHPLLQVLGLADIEHVALGVVHAVHAGRLSQLTQVGSGIETGIAHALMMATKSVQASRSRAAENTSANMAAVSRRVFVLYRLQ